MTSVWHRLLVIDDSLTIRKLVELSFRGAAFALDFATNGADGIVRAADGAPDVIVLDCVLPDMKAADVCQRLERDPRSAGARIILMSAKDRLAVQPLFDRFAQVFDFIGKPFTAEDIRARVEAAAHAHAAADAPAAPRPSDAGAPAPHAVAADPAAASPPSAGAPDAPAVAFGIKETEAAARALYARLARPLASMPDWLRQAAGTPASASSPATPAAPSLPAFLARKLLTPELVAALLDGLLPLYRQALAGERESAPAAAASAPDSDGVPLRGELAGWPLGDLLALIGAAGRTGELVLTHGARRIIAYCESGEILLVTSHDPADHLQRRDDSAAGPDLSTVPGDLRARAEAEQRASGTPIYVTLDEAGALDDALDIAALLHARGVRLLREAHASTPLHYVWRDRKGLPLYALSWGRHISLAEDLQGLGPASVQAGEPTVAQLSLERLRRPSSWAEIDPHLPHPEQCLERSFGFSNKLRALRLTASEQRVLALVDRRVPIRAIAQRSGLPAREVARIAFRLLEIDLVQALPLSALPGPASLGGVPAEPAARPVMVLDLDDEGFCQPLRALLARRSRPVALMDLSHELDLTDAIARERPGLVVLSEAAAAGRLEEIARAVRAAPHLAGTALAAVVDRDSGSSHDALAAAGFDAIWSKPVHYLDLIALLAAEPASAQRLSPSHTQIST